MTSQEPSAFLNSIPGQLLQREKDGAKLTARYEAAELFLKKRRRFSVSSFHRDAVDKNGEKK